jgi:hypothetical protein
MHMVTLAQDNVRSVEHKLRRFAVDLPDQDRNVLNWIATRATALAEDEGGSGTEDSGVSAALGFADEAGIEIRIGWRKAIG